MMALDKYKCKSYTGHTVHTELSFLLDGIFCDVNWFKVFKVFLLLICVLHWCIWNNCNLYLFLFLDIDLPTEKCSSQCASNYIKVIIYKDTEKNLG